jgi:hypothetical protein
LSLPGKNYLFGAGEESLAAGDVAVTGAFALLLAAAGEANGEALADGEACGTGVGFASAGCVCSTERVPVTAGRESVSAINIKAAAAPIVILASNVCVPRGPKAVLETLLAKSAPASALPGCKSTAMTSTTQARIKSPYKK